MRWKTHKVITGFIVFTYSKEVIATISAILGSVFPDAIEFLVYGRKIPLWKHRTLFHWLFLYALILVLIFLNTPYGVLRATCINLRIHPGTIGRVPIRILGSYLIFWFVIGAMLHILEDAITGKVPRPYSFNYKRKDWGIELFRTGSVIEWIIFVVFSILFVLSVYWRFR
ncbi:MAG: hypothetical protein GXO57_02750 [Thermodesulfobacteria bacterium]|nr:hypothetical protein [Thermodesulfobacteriota bacterium]